MKLVVTIARIFTGVLFIFSGLVKAIDPRGLAYKMQEFFEAWAASGFMKGLMATLGDYALSFSIIMITLEVLAGLALLLGWQKKMVAWLLFLLVLFFTFLTSYVLFSGKIRACGCFGDCIPLTPIQTFSKDIFLLLLSILILTQLKYIQPIVRPVIALTLLLLATLGTLYLQWDVMRHLPSVDCLPYKKGNNILALRKMPADAVPDQFQINFVYQKNGEKKSFDAANLPDSSWEFVDREQKLTVPGKNNQPLINDFNLVTEDGADTTDALLGTPGEYYLLFVKDLEDLPSNFSKDKAIVQQALQKNIPVYIVTAIRSAATARYASDGKGTPSILTLDAVALKTAARAGVVLYKMKGAIVQDKWGWADFNKVPGF